MYALATDRGANDTHWDGDIDEVKVWRVNPHFMDEQFFSRPVTDDVAPIEAPQPDIGPEPAATAKSSFRKMLILLTLIVR